MSLSLMRATALHCMVYADSRGEMVAQQPAITGNAVVSLQQPQAGPKADGVVHQDRLAEFVLQPLDHRHRGPVAARHDDRFGLRPVGPVGKLVGGLRPDPAEVDRGDEADHLAVNDLEATRFHESHHRLSISLLHGAPIAIFVMPSPLSASTNAVAAVVAGRSEASSIRLISSRS